MTAVLTDRYTVDVDGAEIPGQGICQARYPLGL